MPSGHLALVVMGVLALVVAGVVLKHVVRLLVGAAAVAALLVMTGHAGLLAPVRSALAGPAGKVAASAASAAAKVAGHAASGAISSAEASALAAAGGHLPVAAGHGWTTRGLSGPAYVPGACSYRTSLTGQTLPDRSCTPGALDPAVTQATYLGTICRPGGYTKTVRPPASMTGPEKAKAMRAYSVTGAASGYEFDHLVPLSLGGASDRRNLWPEPNVGGTGGFDINAKDIVEDRLHTLVCSGKVPLPKAQAAIAADWSTALAVLGHPTGR